MKPIFFGDSKRKLYGVYAPPTGASRRSHAVLLCYPGLQEYGTSHWSFRRLSAMLAREGHHVLRFDYFGTGDSAGNVEDVTLGRQSPFRNPRGRGPQAESGHFREFLRGKAQ